VNVDEDDLPSGDSNGPSDSKLPAYHLTDLGNAKRPVAQHGADLRFCHTWKKWLVWDGKRFEVDESGEVERRAKDTVLTIYNEAAAEQDNDSRAELVRWAKGSESSGRIHAMVGLATSELGIPVAPDNLDADLWLLNCANGTLDLRSGELREHRREVEI
jgi:putative DNA primase/helicase